MPCQQDRAMSGAAGGPLSREQKKRVCMLARVAWEAAGKPGWADQAEDLPREIRLSDREAFDLWRHSEQRKAVGCEHLTCSQNRAFPLLMAHFARLAGREREADYWAGRTVADPQRQALSALRREMSQAAGEIERPEDYVRAIARCRFKAADVDTLSPRQIWGLVFDLRRAAQRRRAKGAGAPF